MRWVSQDGCRGCGSKHVRRVHGEDCFACNECGRISLPPDRYKKKKIPLAVKVAVFVRDGRKCKICGDTERLTLDHIVPEIYGGPATVENLRVLCKSCNSRKGIR